jgi:hypothetical protein
MATQKKLGGKDMKAQKKKTLAILLVLAMVLSLRRD